MSNPPDLTPRQAEQRKKEATFIWRPYKPGFEINQYNQLRTAPVPPPPPPKT